MPTATFDEVDDKLTANFDAVDVHLRKVLNITLTDRLEFWQPKGVNNYAIIAPLILLYRYAEALPKKIIIHDASVGGHKSHTALTELDFTYAKDGFNAMRQADVISDLLNIRKIMKPQLTAYRLGFYFDNFTNHQADTLDRFRELYGSKKLSSNHLGIRYPWTSSDYEGNTPSKKYGYFAFWGQGLEGFGEGERWAKRILSWNLGLLPAGRAQLIAQRVMDDFKMLDRNPPSYIMLGAEVY